MGIILVLLLLFPRFFFSSPVLTVRHKNIISILNNEFKVAMGKVRSPGLAFLLVRLFYCLFQLSRAYTLYFYSHKTFSGDSFSNIAPMVGIYGFIIFKNFNSFLRHLVP